MAPNVVNIHGKIQQQVAPTITPRLQHNTQNNKAIAKLKRTNKALKKKLETNGVPYRPAIKGNVGPKAQQKRQARSELHATTKSAGTDTDSFRQFCDDMLFRVDNAYADGRLSEYADEMVTNINREILKDERETDSWDSRRELAASHVNDEKQRTIKRARKANIYNTKIKIDGNTNQA
eukprot:1086929_1